MHMPCEAELIRQAVWRVNRNFEAIYRRPMLEARCWPEGSSIFSLIIAEIGSDSLREEMLIPTRAHHFDISKNHAPSKPDISQQILDYALKEDQPMRGD
jgi:hypothetical protein